MCDADSPPTCAPDWRLEDWKQGRILAGETKMGVNELAEVVRPYLMLSEAVPEACNNPSQADVFLPRMIGIVLVRVSSSITTRLGSRLGY